MYELQRWLLPMTHLLPVILHTFSIVYDTNLSQHFVPQIVLQTHVSTQMTKMVLPTSLFILKIFYSYILVIYSFCQKSNLITYLKVFINIENI